jgi:hypothetical protein
LTDEFSLCFRRRFFMLLIVKGLPGVGWVEQNSRFPAAMTKQESGA